MNSLPRILGMGLLVVLAALVALLAVPAWQGVQTSPPVARAVAVDMANPPPLPSATARLAALPLRLSLALALVALALAVTLIFCLALRRGRSSDSTPPYAAARSEINTLAKLAETSVAQGEELTRERDVRRRAEEDVLLKQQLLAQSVDEKIRIGRDLHDGIIQSLYAIGLTLESVRALVKINPDEADRRLEQTRAGLNDTIRDVRAYITGLAPENLRRGGFSHALSALLLELQAGRDARFDIKIDDEAAAMLTAEQSLQALQIAREAVSNALRHGHASIVTLRLHMSDQEVCLLVQDNGAGFDPTVRRDGGHGLVNMQARSERLGATLRVTSRPGEGARVLATLPILDSPSI